MGYGISTVSSTSGTEKENIDELPVTKHGTKEDQRDIDEQSIMIAPASFFASSSSSPFLFLLSSSFSPIAELELACRACG